jgi:hypothetical protein
VLYLDDKSVDLLESLTVDLSVLTRAGKMVLKWAGKWAWKLAAR